MFHHLCPSNTISWRLLITPDQATTSFPLQLKLTCTLVYMSEVDDLVSEEHNIYVQNVLTTMSPSGVW